MSCVHGHTHIEEFKKSRHVLQMNGLNMEWKDVPVLTGVIIIKYDST